MAGGLWRACVDPGELENTILNLAVNSRDAMPAGGRLTIETSNAHLDEQYAAQHIGVVPGQYILVAVTDTGCGMSKDVADKAFDPFFTTKPVGRGTGLGLSQVFGFVRQSGGHVKVYSEPGQGTTVKIYLPRFYGIADGTASPSRPASDILIGKLSDVILVVEDDEQVRLVAVESLRDLDYTVLHASSAATALMLLDSHPDISLLFTDIVMPDTNGRQLADEAVRRRPKLKVLYTTGYTRNAIVHNGVLDSGVDLIGKPYSVEDLARKVREALDRP
ncbi:MAG: histidine kinase [Hyphomicrobiales bacterium]|nr:histidine kinase [Hyphomicrobiales bacterium]